MEVEYAVGTMIELPRAALRAVRDRRGGRLLLVRHQRPHPDHARVQPRRRREQVPDALPPAQRDRLQPVRDHRPGGGRQAGRDGRGRRAGREARHQARASAASTAATRPRSTSSTAPASTTCPAPRSGSRPPGSPRAAPPSAPPDGLGPWASDDGRYELAIPRRPDRAAGRGLADHQDALRRPLAADRAPPAAFFALARGAGETRGVFVPDDGRALSHHALVELFRENPAIWKHRSFATVAAPAARAPRPRETGARSPSPSRTPSLLGPATLRDGGARSTRPSRSAASTSRWWPWSATRAARGSATCATPPTRARAARCACST